MAEIDDLTLLGWTILGIAIVLVTHFIGELVSKKKLFCDRIVTWESLGAGIFVGGFFLEVLPKILVHEEVLGEYVYLIFLLSTVAVHLLEKQLFKHAIRHRAKTHPNEPQQEESKKHLSLEELAKQPRDRRLIFEAIALVVHGLLIGAIIPDLFLNYQILALYLIMPFVVHWFTVASCTDHLDYALHSKLEHFVRDISPLVGGLVGIILIHNEIGYGVYIMILMGFITYIMVRDFLPRSDKGKPLYFLLGIGIMIVFFFIFSEIRGGF